MKTWAYLTLFSLCFSDASIAGFRHPIEQSGADAVAIQSTPIHTATSQSSRRMLPDRAIEISKSSAPQSRGLKETADATPSGKNTPANSPIPKAAPLPASVRFGIPQVQLPHSPQRDGLLTMKPDPEPLKGANRAQIHAFLRKARSLPLPGRSFTTEVRSREIAQRYHAALHPAPYRSFRTSYKLGLSPVGKILNPPAAIEYENIVKRIDSLFHGLNHNYPKASLGLWELAEASVNPPPLQARDALFAGVISSRAGWEVPAAMLMEESVRKRIELKERYLRILWSQLEQIENPSLVDFVVAKINPHRVAKFSPSGNKANFAMAKRMMREAFKAPLLNNPRVDTFSKMISSKELVDKVQLMTALRQLRSSDKEARDEAEAKLKTLESESSEGIQQDARLALARSSLQKGVPQDALALYKKIQKTGKNRLEVLAEETYAEYRSGEFQASLGKTMALQSPYFQFGFAPDIHLVEILSRKAMCDFGGAEVGVQRFTERYAEELKALEAKLAEKKSAADFYEELIGYHEIEHPKRFQRYLLQLSAVMENQKTMNHALGDLKRINEVGIKQKIIERPAGWDQFSAAMRQRWDERAKELRRASAEAALAEAAYMAKRLRHTFAQIELLDLDISTAASKNYNLQSALNFPVRKAPETQADPDKLNWPFEDEIWEDEIDFMKAKNPSKCAVTAAL